MLMKDSEEQLGNVSISIGNDPVMKSTLEVMSFLGQNPRVTLKAKGNSIPNAVAVANIITEKILLGNSHVRKIKLDTDKSPGIGRMLSTIEIILQKE